MPDPSPQQQRPRVLSGMRPTGRLHLGNYMGALYNWVALQNELQGPADPDPGQPKYDCFFFIADWHALTTDYADPSQLKQNVFEIALDFLAAGLDPERSTIFIQSHVPQHAELHLLLSMITPVSWLERVPTYKDQQEQLKEKDLATYGFLGYPLLQSADILLYRPHFVPVGADQVAHVEITREVARRFNFLYTGSKAHPVSRREQSTAILNLNVELADESLVHRSDGSFAKQALEDGEQPPSELLPEPQALLTPSPKLPGTDGRKMSKSYGNSILLTDSRVLILEKMHGMTNGGQRPTQHDPGDPEICPVGDLHRVFSKPYVDEHIRTGCRTATIRCDECKQLAGLSIIEHVGPIQTRREELEGNPDLVWNILEAGARRASATAEVTLNGLRAVTGLSRDRSGVRSYRSYKSDPEQVRDLTQFSDWWPLNPLILNRNLRELWAKSIRPVTVEVKPAGDGVWTTRINQRVFVAAAIEDRSLASWTFSIKPKSYEVVVLLCWGTDFHLLDFVLPQKLFVAPWTAAKKAAGKHDMVFTVTYDGAKYFLNLPNAPSIDLTGTEAAYKIISD